MPTKERNNKKNLLRIIVLGVVGVVAFVVSVYMNFTGIKGVINKEPEYSGMADFSVRTNTNSSSKTETRFDESGKVAEEDLLVNAVPVIQLNNNKWDRLKAGFKDYKLEGQNAVFEEGFTLYCDGTYVRCVVFSDKYEKEIVGHLKVGESFETIEQKLGTPTFKRDDCIGYKTKEVYVFFYENEVSVYQNKKYSNKDLEILISNYIDGIYENGRTYFLANIRNNYTDFIIKKDETTDTMIVSSITRQITLKLDELGNIEVELYNGYEISEDLTRNYIKQGIYKENKEDLTEILESERTSVR